jgi:hypothetical protein
MGWLSNYQIENLNKNQEIQVCQGNIRRLVIVPAADEARWTGTLYGANLNLSQSDIEQKIIETVRKDSSFLNKMDEFIIHYNPFARANGLKPIHYFLEAHQKGKLMGKDNEATAKLVDKAKINGDFEWFPILYMVKDQALENNLNLKDYTYNVKSLIFLKH